MRSLFIAFSQFRRFSLRTHPVHVAGYPLFNLIYLTPYLHKGRTSADFITLFFLDIELTVHLNHHGEKISIILEVRGYDGTGERIIKFGTVTLFLEVLPYDIDKIGRSMILISTDADVGPVIRTVEIRAVRHIVE